MLLSTVLTLVALEVAIRVYRGAGLGSGDGPEAYLKMHGDVYPTRYDRELGYTPAPNVQRRDVLPWKTPIHTDALGLRLHSRRSGDDTVASILAVGDSFTFGDQVGDTETWPAALERKLQRTVHNAGVFGYGFDQIVLRAESLLEKLDVELLIVSLIPDDIRRCEYAYRFAHKPYFDIASGTLQLRNTPVPGPAAATVGSTKWQRTLHHSFLAELVLHRLRPLGWFDRGLVRVHRDGARVAEALVHRLADGAARGPHRLLFVTAWHPGADSRDLDSLVDTARSRGIDVLRLEPPMRALIRERGGDWSELYFARGPTLAGHMTPLGNQHVGEIIAAHVSGGISQKWPHRAVHAGGR